MNTCAQQGLIRVLDNSSREFDLAMAGRFGSLCFGHHKIPDYCIQTTKSLPSGRRQLHGHFFVQKLERLRVNAERLASSPKT